LLDVAHNPAAAVVLAGTLGSDQHPGETAAIIGMLDDKDIGGVVEPLNQHVDRWIAVTADSHRATGPCPPRSWRGRLPMCVADPA
jgi:dihydrofolate synthase/folylpolyglutamate synthase